MTRHLTPSGRFEVVREGGVLSLRHGVTGLHAGGFSHIAVRTIKAALAGVTQAESRLTSHELALIDAIREGDECSTVSRLAQHALVDALREAFPNGAWSR